MDRVYRGARVTPMTVASRSCGEGLLRMREPTVFGHFESTLGHDRGKTH